MSSPHGPLSWMRRTGLLLFFALLTSITAHAQECPVMVWSDEFDDTTLDDTRWTHQLGDGCAIGLCGWGNNELQYYQPANATVADGVLRITARRETVQGRSYTSSRIRSMGKGEWTFGRFEARMKLTEGQGLWPAFWMMPTDEVYGGWPQSGEIDIMENIGREPEVVHGTIHFGDPSPNNRNSGEAYRLHDGAFADDFHTFAVEKEPGVIRWFVDDVLYSTKTAADTDPHPWPFDERFHFILNVAVGGNFPGNPDASTAFPQVLEVDYVRVYDRSLPHIAGDRVVAFRENGVRYMVGNAPSGGTITWTVPPGASITAGQGTAEILVDWGDAGGPVNADVSSPCGADQLTIDVRVESAFAREFSFENFDDPENARRVFSSGSMVEINNPDPNGINASARSGRYTRNSSQQYDVLVLSTEAIRDATDYREGRKKFYIDLFTTAPVGTTVILQLESTARVSSPYPVGRHSRYEARTTVQNQWERLELPLLDRPDPDTPDDEIDQIVILFAPNTFTGHVYTFDNLDSYASTIGTSAEREAPRTFRLHQNYPNPFNRSTEIRYELERPVRARLRVYNVLGELVATPVDAVQAAGSYRVRYDASGLPSGVYLYRLDAGATTETRRMVLAK